MTAANTQLTMASDAETYYGANDHIVFIPSKGLPGVDFTHKAVKASTSYTLTIPRGAKTGISLCWEDVRELRKVFISCRAMDNYSSDRKRLTASFDRSDREADYHWPFNICLTARRTVTANA